MFVKRHRLCASTASPGFFYADTAPIYIATLSLHDALPISIRVFHHAGLRARLAEQRRLLVAGNSRDGNGAARSEEHTSELQSLRHLVCRLLLEKKNATVDA